MEETLKQDKTESHKEFEKLLKQHSFSINKMEDIGRRQLSYSINNHGDFIIPHLRSSISP